MRLKKLCVAAVLCPAVVATAFAAGPQARRLWAGPWRPVACFLKHQRKLAMLAAADSLNRGVPQHVGSKPYTSIDAASDAEVLGDSPIDPYVGTALGTRREAYCAENSDLPSAAVADALAWVESETRTRLSKDYMLTGSLVCECNTGYLNYFNISNNECGNYANQMRHLIFSPYAILNACVSASRKPGDELMCLCMRGRWSQAATTLAMLVRMSGAKNVLEIGAYTGYAPVSGVMLGMRQCAYLLRIATCPHARSC